MTAQDSLLVAPRELPASATSPLWFCHCTQSKRCQPAERPGLQLLHSRVRSGRTAALQHPRPPPPPPHTPSDTPRAPVPTIRGMCEFECTFLLLPPPSNPSSVPAVLSLYHRQKIHLRWNLNWVPLHRNLNCLPVRCNLNWANSVASKAIFLPSFLLTGWGKRRETRSSTRTNAANAEARVR
eukprot:3933470-Rhodomonas_salina.3